MGQKGQMRPEATAGSLLQQRSQGQVQTLRRAEAGARAEDVSGA